MTTNPTPFAVPSPRCAAARPDSTDLRNRVSHQRVRRCLAALSTAVSMLAFAGCGGNAAEPKTPSAKASIELAPMEELKAIPKDLEADVAELTKPIDDIQSAIDDLTNIPKKHGIAASDMALMAKATFDSGKVSLQLNTDATAEAKADVEATLTRLNNAVIALKAVPEKTAALASKVVAALAKVPVLSAKITSSATVTASNPFGDADAKAKAKADLESVKQVQADVMKSVNDLQKKVADIPAKATGALAKLTASFSAGSAGG